MEAFKPASIDQYITGFPKEIQDILEAVRMAIKAAAPDAEESISYGIPTFKLNGHYLIYFAGYKKHISIYPAPREHEAFREELSAYKGGKGTVQFPLSQPIPFDLINKIVKFRMKENLGKRESKPATSGNPF